MKSLTPFALVLFISLSGCANHLQQDRPADWNTGLALSAYAGGKTHSAHEDYDLRPLENGTQPSRCVAYQEAREDDRDSCTVYGPREDRDAGRTFGPWTIEATWDGAGERLHEDVELHPERRTVVAFDEKGAVIAHWDGLRRDPDGSFWTE